MQNSAYVELHVPDFEKVKDYYGKPGFRVMRVTSSTLTLPSPVQKSTLQPK